MKNGRTTLGCIAGAFALWVAANVPAAESAGSPYQGIVDRNVFGLKPPPPPPTPEDNKPPPPRITLQGITSILGKPLALMKILAPAKPGAKQEEVPLTLSVGMREEGVEVLQIDLPSKDQTGMVKVNNSGTITNLTFENNGVKLASGPAPGAPPPGAPPGAAGGVPPPGGNPALTPAGGGYPYQPRSIPTSRTPRMNPAGASAYSPGYGGAPAPTVYSAVPTAQAYGTTPVSTTPGTVALSGLGAPASAPKAQQNWPPETPMTPEQATIIEAAYTMKYQKQISEGTMPSIPGENPLIDSGNTPGQTKTPSHF